ncbi:Hypothetical protein A7982_03343 [Minicystis rosea]|nr:Hypothetical protein A7982_03343 [Minicystis rosea]
MEPVPFSRHSSLPRSRRPFPEALKYFASVVADTNGNPRSISRHSVLTHRECHEFPMDRSFFERDKRRPTERLLTRRRKRKSITSRLLKLLSPLDAWV